MHHKGRLKTLFLRAVVKHRACSKGCFFAIFIRGQSPRYVV
ncbi:hypothetical protein MCC93_14590 [Morococcus cerebrosus]|uniref:Uncharacterized protein n=1 Tax=Morococcus cerebrosus TaxID=1056807 RepID=A0A0C1EEU4_9NEIS|nr:hypothetical protein MCC93_14590 [Morococcus cerebrosus]